MSDLEDRYRSLRAQGYDEWGAGIELRIPPRTARDLERRMGRQVRRDTEVPPVPSEAEEEGDQKEAAHIGAVLANGGFPRVVVLSGAAHWLGPDNRHWRLTPATRSRR